MRIYLDICCFNRPFDDQRQARIRLESEAVRAILALVRLKSLDLVASDVLMLEVARSPEERRRDACASMIGAARIRVPFSARLERESEVLTSMGFRALDAAHLASAIHAKCSLFFTVDDVLLRVARRNASMIPCLVTNPAARVLRQIRGGTR